MEDDPLAHQDPRVDGHLGMENAVGTDPAPRTDHRVGADAHSVSHFGAFPHNGVRPHFDLGSQPYTAPKDSGRMHSSACRGLRMEVFQNGNQGRVGISHHHAGPGVIESFLQLSSHQQGSSLTCRDVGSIARRDHRGDLVRQSGRQGGYVIDLEIRISG